MGNRMIKFGDISVCWDDEYLFLKRNGVEEWRVAWTAVSRVVISTDKPTAYVFICADGNELRLPVGTLRWLKLETLLSALDIEVVFERTNKPLRKMQWTLKNHFAVGALPDFDGKGNLFASKYDLALESIKLLLSVYCLVMAVFFATILYLVSNIVYMRLTHGYPVFHSASDGSFFVVFAVLSLAGLPFVVRPPLLHYRTRQVRKLSLLFSGEKLYVVEGETRQEASLIKRKIGLLLEYCLVERNGKKLVFDLLMTEQR